MIHSLKAMVTQIAENERKEKHAVTGSKGRGPGGIKILPWHSLGKTLTHFGSFVGHLFLHLQKTDSTTQNDDLLLVIR